MFVISNDGFYCHIHDGFVVNWLQRMFSKNTLNLPPSTTKIAIIECNKLSCLMNNCVNSSWLIAKFWKGISSNNAILGDMYSSVHTARAVMILFKTSYLLVLIGTTSDLSVLVVACPAAIWVMECGVSSSSKYLFQFSCRFSMTSVSWMRSYEPPYLYLVAQW